MFGGGQGPSASLLPILRPTGSPQRKGLPQRCGLPRPRPLAHVDIHGLGGGAFCGQTLPSALLPGRTVVPEDSPAGGIGPRGIHSPVSIDDGPAPRTSKCWRWQIRTREAVLSSSPLTSLLAGNPHTPQTCTLPHAPVASLLPPPGKEREGSPDFTGGLFPVLNGGVPGRTN